MHIALFHNLPSGGAKRTVYEQVSRLRKYHHVDLFTLSTADIGFTDISSLVGRIYTTPFKPGRLFGSPFGRLNQAVRILDIFRLHRVMRAIANMINNGEYDLAFVHPCMFTFSPIILQYIKIPSLYYRQDPVRWIHEPKIMRPYQKHNGFRSYLDLIDPLMYSYKRLLEDQDQSSMNAATRVITNSYFNRESMYRIYGNTPDVCYHGVDLEIFKPLNLERKDFILSVGAVSPYKGYDFIIESLSRIPLDKRPFLMIVANASLSEEMHYLEDMASQLKVKIQIEELVSDHELVLLYNQAICTVYAPVMEPFGLVPLESMACGTPVVGIREGGVRETVIDGVTGFLGDRDPGQFAELIQRFLNDPLLIENLGSQSRSYVEKKWTWDLAICKLENYIQRTSNVETEISRTK